MIRTSKKDIEAEIMRGNYYEISSVFEIEYARKNFKRVAYSCSNAGFTGLVFVAPSGNFHATTDKNLIAKY